MKKTAAEEKDAAKKEKVPAKKAVTKTHAVKAPAKKAVKPKEPTPRQAKPVRVPADAKPVVEVKTAPAAKKVRRSAVRPAAPKPPAGSAPVPAAARPDLAHEAEKAAPVAHAVRPAAPAPEAPPVSPAAQKPSVAESPSPTPAVPAAEKAAPRLKKPFAPQPPVPPAAAAVQATPAAIVEKQAPAAVLRELEIQLPVTLKDLSVKLQEKPSVLIKALMDMRVFATINQVLDEEMVKKLCVRYGCTLKAALDDEEQLLQDHEQRDDSGVLRPRPPIVTFMGHVDHGKTSLLDAIRKTKVVDSEHGGITQHIGAYSVTLPGGTITFLDTPGHEAFTAMRARGARITDIVVLVVAADDGVMPQTREALDHARAAGVTIMVALNKIDKPQAQPDVVKKQLAALNLMSEDWGGKTVVAAVSAKTGQGIDELLELILLEAQLLELKANPDRPAKGVVVEAKLSKGKGPVVTLLVQNGTLHLNETIIVGQYSGKIRAMFDARGHALPKAGPAVPVEVFGIAGVPAAGEPFFVVKDERTAREIAAQRQEKEKQQQMKSVRRISLEDLHAQILEGKIKDLKVIIKADVQGSLEAIKDVLEKLNVSEIKIECIHEGVGSINSSDVILAVASNALILGFNVQPDEPAKELIAREGVDVKTYNVIYELGNDIKAAVEGMLEPKLKKTFVGKVEVRKVFRLSRSGMVAGCFVSKGKITRTSPVRLVRNGQQIFEGTLSSLKRFKDDVREVVEGFECGLTLQGFDAVQEGDVVEAFEVERIARKLA